MSQDFSDAPLMVNGITVKPTWAWSKQYRAKIAKEMRQATQSDLSPKEIKRRYIEWYAVENGLTYHQARQKLQI